MRREIYLIGEDSHFFKWWVKQTCFSGSIISDWDKASGGLQGCGFVYVSKADPHPASRTPMAFLNLTHLFLFIEIERTLTISYPFIRHIPVVIVISVSRNSRYAKTHTGKSSKTLWKKDMSFALIPARFDERKISGYNCQFAAGRAITGNRHNDTPV